jgi:hypothetical protein
MSENQEYLIFMEQESKFDNYQTLSEQEIFDRELF